MNDEIAEHKRPGRVRTQATARCSRVMPTSTSHQPLPEPIGTSNKDNKAFGHLPPRTSLISHLFLLPLTMWMWVPRQHKAGRKAKTVDDSGDWEQTSASAGSLIDSTLFPASSSFIAHPNAFAKKVDSRFPWKASAFSFGAWAVSFDKEGRSTRVLSVGTRMRRDRGRGRERQTDREEERERERQREIKTERERER